MTVRCANCASEMPDDMRFCGVCGQRLEVRCATCGTPARMGGQRFCGNCGSPLVVGGAEPRERRLVSVLFCDLVGFTTFSEGRDPEDVRDVLEHYFTAARAILARYGGTIEKFIGDAVMAVWGAPIAREDDAQRAVRAALEITQAVADLSRQLDIAQLCVRVGILTGEASVEVGGRDRGMLVGDAVNTASRIQSVAKPGTVLVDDTTRLACERSVLFEDAGRHELKGKSAPVRVWRALRVLSGDAEEPGPVVQPPFVGREDQMRTITDALVALRSDAARPCLVSVIADAGLGKSRLASEAQAQSAGITWYRGRVLSFGEGAGLSALAEIVGMRAGIAHGDPPERRLGLADELIAECFGPADPNHERVRRAVLRLLDLDEGSALIEQGELFSAWRLLFERLAEGGPVALVFEELQAADQALLDFIAHLLEWSQDAPILSIALGRPESRVHELADRGVRIELAPLREPQMDELVRGAVVDPPPGLLSAVRADGGGVPLYAVETLRALADRGALAVVDGRYVVHGELGEVTVAPTVRALVASRLDSLGTLERRVLTAGAVLGERFTAAGAAAVAGLGEADARALLDGLVGRALLGLDREPRSPLRGLYCFLQGVVRRVALSTLARRELARHHLAAADHLAGEPSEPERATALAGHLLEALRSEPAATDADPMRRRARAALGEAAERAAAVGALEQAMSLYDTAAELSAQDDELAVLLESAAAVANRAGDAQGAARRYGAAGEAHAGAGRERERLRARANELRSLRYVRPPSELLAELREVHEALAAEADAACAIAGGALAYTLYQCGEHAEALSVATRAVAVAEAVEAVPELLHALGAQGNALAELARPQEAIDVYSRALALAQTHSPRLVAPLACNLAVSQASLGRHVQAVAVAGEAIASAERTADRFFERWARLVLSRALCSLGEYDAAIVAIESVREHVPVFLIGMATAPLVVIALARGEVQRARDLVADHDRRCREADASAFESDFRALRAAVLTAPDDPAELAAIVSRAQVADYAEWAGWLAPIVDRLVQLPAGEAHTEQLPAGEAHTEQLPAGEAHTEHLRAGEAHTEQLPAGEAHTEHLRSALAALRRPGEMKQTAPVLAQALRLEAHLAARGGDSTGALGLFTRAGRLARECGLAFEKAVIDLEAAEVQMDASPPATPDAAVVAAALATFARLRAAPPWLSRAQAVLGALEAVHAGHDGH